MVGNSTGLAPAERNRSLKAPACSRARVTSTCFPANGRLRVSNMREFLLPCSNQCTNNFIRSLDHCLFSQSFAEILSILNCQGRCTGYTLLNPHLLLSIKTNDEATKGQRFIHNSTVRSNWEITTSPQNTHKGPLSNCRSL